jgi:hypothetical protein
MTDSDESRGTEDSSRLEDPLSATDLEFFVQNGFVLLKKAFDPDVAAACRSEIWQVIEGESRAAREEGNDQGKAPVAGGGSWDNGLSESGVYRTEGVWTAATEQVASPPP